MSHNKQTIRVLKGPDENPFKIKRHDFPATDAAGIAMHYTNELSEKTGAITDLTIKEVNRLHSGPTAKRKTEKLRKNQKKIKKDVTAHLNQYIKLLHDYDSTPHLKKPTDEDLEGVANRIRKNAKLQLNMHKFNTYKPYSHDLSVPGKKKKEKGAPSIKSLKQNFK